MFIHEVSKRSEFDIVYYTWPPRDEIWTSMPARNNKRAIGK